MKKPKIILFVLLTAALWGAPYKAAAQIFAVRANALAACSATLNVGAEAALTDNCLLSLKLTEVIFCPLLPKKSI